MVKEEQVLRYPLHIGKAPHILMILEFWVNEIHDLGDLGPHASLCGQFRVLNLVLDESLKHGHAQIVLDVERVDCRARLQLLVVADQDHVTRFMRQRRHNVCLKHLGCLLHYDYREIDGLK
jgi:hypothetical protein